MMPKSYYALYTVCPLEKYLKYFKFKKIQILILCLYWKQVDFIKQDQFSKATLL